MATQDSDIAFEWQFFPIIRFEGDAVILGTIFVNGCNDMLSANPSVRL